jgi:hypothetical protein
VGQTDRSIDRERMRGTRVKIIKDKREMKRIDRDRKNVWVC